MSKRMLIDALHPEQTRVAIIDGNRIDDLDFESASRKQIKGNIYLAKITRIEPSLQAAFVEYGGNRHGFLSFAEIHPDYYRLPIADREKLEAMLNDATTPKRERPHPIAPDEQSENDAGEGDLAALGPIVADEEPDTDPTEKLNVQNEPDGPAFSVKDWLGTPAQTQQDDDSGDEDEQAFAALPLLRADRPAPVRREIPEELADLLPGLDSPNLVLDGPLYAPDPLLGPAPHDESLPPLPAYDAPEESYDAGSVPSELPQTEVLDGADDADEDVDESEDGTAADEHTLRRLRQRFMRHYKIQEVIKRRQVLLIQVVKEERGNKGAALTTYLSLPGRYCVLMPNSPKGGGVSRKVTNPAERRRLKEILDRLDIPAGMSVILRTAGIERTDAEIRRDFEYLLRLWDTIREQTLKSTAPALIYEEGNLIKRSIRDLYDNHISEILVTGETGYQHARNFMEMLMPTHVSRVVNYNSSAVPLFFRYQAESQIEALDSPIVQLRSGGYLVINPTEALVAIDVNSGRATRERDIEETALRTNLEAADEIGRQVRLRDLAGLIVIDFIDMEDGRNNAMVERRMKEAMKNDRARVQIGRISPFGLLELSRQRMRPSLLETNCEKCPHCSGSGYMKTPDTAALSVLRAIEEEGIRNRASELIVYLPAAVAMQIVNHKRTMLAEIEARYGFNVIMRIEDISGQAFRIERTRSRPVGPGTDIAPITGDMVSADSALGPIPDSGSDDEFGESATNDESPATDRNSGNRDDRDSRRGGNGKRRRGRHGRGGERGDNRGGDNRGGNRGEWRERPQAPHQESPVLRTDEATAPSPTLPTEPRGNQPPVSDDIEGNGNHKRRRGRRGGRRRHGGDRDQQQRQPGGGQPGGEHTQGNQAPDQTQYKNDVPGPAAVQQNRPPRESSAGWQPRTSGQDRDQNFGGNSAPFEIDTTPQISKADQTGARSGETVNQAPEKPRTGWWRRLTGV